MPQKIEVTTLRTLSDAQCTERGTCVGRHKVAGVPGSFVVLKQVTDPDVAAHLARRVGAGELLGWTPDELFDPYQEA